jgi:hypothetical protein
MKYLALLALLPLAAYAGDTPMPKKPTQAQYQDQHQRQGQEQAQANSQSVTFEDKAQAPSLAQGGLYLSGCGFSANAGGSQTGGAGFLGVQFITRYCRDQAQIANEAAFGNVKTACEMNRLTPAGQRNLKRLKDAGLEPEPCPGAEPKPELIPSVVVIEGESCAAKERVERVLEKCISK